ncbi:hypothetical protein UA08_00774 [Talaromyces atroroseus]|uniref:Major facilitator superfamily (MFS) profile domain-containing protein n=1 Tax=Talaromyces atroroseus TaxID=1441469 RepID=A0A225AZF5_TALAT|nr:hypothetical protein UA08_00774 [Talaromyces atroroseus]OKL63834.1 hypothetical protein UA08_00774 [Talaromyces atroroseus]
MATDSIRKDIKAPDAQDFGSVNVGDSTKINSGDYSRFLELNVEFSGAKLKKLIRKCDFHVLPQLIFIYLMSYVDRTNVSNAKLFGIVDDLDLGGQRWNTCLCIFFVTYAFGGVPSNIALKRFGPKIWLPVLMTSISLVMVFTSLLSNYAGWAAFRVILGLVEAGVFPGCSFVLTQWYSPQEVSARMGIFYSGASAAGAFSGLLAYGIGQLDYTWGYRGWRFIYCIEGVFSFCIAVAGFWLVYDTPAKVKWLTPEEKEFLTLRHKFSAGGENTGIGEKEGFSWKHARSAFRSPHIYAVAATEFTLCVAVYGYGFVLPTIINNLGFSAARAQAMTVPPYVFACVVTAFSGYMANKWQKRMLPLFLVNLMALIGFVIMMVSVRYPSIPGVTLFGVFLTTGGLYPVSPLATAWISLNCAGTMKRAVGIGAMISFSQLGGIVGSNIYIADTAPKYPVGFGISIGMLAVFGCIWPPTYALILKRINAKRAAISEEEVKAKYTEEELAEMGDEIHHHGSPHTFTLPISSTLDDLSSAISVSADLQIPIENQKLLIAPKLGLQKPPFDAVTPLAELLPLSSPKFKITLLGTKAQDIDSMNETIQSNKHRLAARAQARRQPHPPISRRPPGGIHTLSSPSSSAYTFGRCEPLPYLPNPARSLTFLERLRDDPGIKFAMAKHRFFVPLLTEMNPAEHTTHESRTLGLNRNKGEVIELRLRTDAYDGYRDYRTIRKTLCHELAHCVHSEHDRNFWDLTKQIEIEVEKGDWTRGGHRLSEQEFYNPQDWETEGQRSDDEWVDHGGWTGGEFVLGRAEPSTTAAAAGEGSQALSRREIMARAAEDRLKKEQHRGKGSNSNAEE